MITAPWKQEAAHTQGHARKLRGQAGGRGRGASGQGLSLVVWELPEMRAGGPWPGVCQPVGQGVGQALHWAFASENTLWQVSPVSRTWLTLGRA